MIKRDLNQVVSGRFDDGKAIIILGARQVGKTTFIENLLQKKEYLLIDCDDPLNIEILETARKEITTKRRIYFYDNGIRNTLISNL